jgi:hypothetical protein
MIRKTIIQDIFITKINTEDDVDDLIIKEYSGKCFKNAGVINKLEELDIEPAQISANGYLLKFPFKLKVECIVPELNCCFPARAAKIYDDFALFFPFRGGREIRSIKIAVPNAKNIEEGQVYDIELLHFKFSNGNYNCTGIIQGN